MDIIYQVMSDHANKYGMVELLQKLAHISLRQSLTVDCSHCSQLAVDLAVMLDQTAQGFTEAITQRHNTTRSHV